MSDQKKQFEDVVFEYASFENKKTEPDHVYIVRFGAFITQFEDDYEQTWNSTVVYGKVDPIETYRNTTRKIRLSWDVPSTGPAEGYANMMKIESLIRMLYPVYDKIGQTKISTIKQSPVLRLKFANLIHNGSGRGLLGHVGGFSFKPDLAQGMYNTNHPQQFMDLANFPNSPMSTRLRGGKSIEDVGLIPKTYSLSCNFTVLHEQDLGFGRNKKFRTPRHPYDFAGAAGGEDALREINGVTRAMSDFSDIGSSNQETPAEILEARYENILRRQKP
tara:strand:+ start:5323 stop:6147 length:825 start_codon:yes stop_codon:yes gene_type:complete